MVAGTLDAADRNAILATQKVDSKNIDEQLRINSRLFDATHESITRISKVIAKVNAIDGDIYATTGLLSNAIIVANKSRKTQGLAS